jgi:hypothetical protein
LRLFAANLLRVFLRVLRAFVVLFSSNGLRAKPAMGILCLLWQSSFFASSFESYAPSWFASLLPSRRGEFMTIGLCLAAAMVDGA